MNVLFLSVSAGGGHMRAAECLSEYIRTKSPSSQVLIIDTLKYVNPLLDKLVIGSYLKAVRSTPSIYGKLYALSENRDNLSDFSSYVNRLFSPRLKKLILNFQPDIVICTHPFPLQMLAGLRRKRIIGVPVVGIITDFTTHSFWVNGNADAFIVASREMKQEMIEKGIAPSKVFDLGIPISKEFVRNKNLNHLIEQFNLQKKPTLLIMGGSLGYGEIREVFLSLLQSQRDIQMLVVTGKNLKLKRQLERWSRTSTKAVKIFSYTNKVSDLMAVSDLIFTKPGGLTISETLAMHLPIVIISPIPGQEEKNAQFLVDKGVAVRLPENGNVEDILRELLDNPKRLTEMKKKTMELSRPYSCKNIYPLLCQLINSTRGSSVQTEPNAVT